ncbi:MULTISPECIES: LysR family transcriptional regulator [Rhodomicrobium]|uniref:LysR family transcriptional regulator n=1 Tax=Rhodomicrobium TaxID=1068 RepID=UPI000B4B8344|nr:MULTISPECIES: LysR family transcriptional regulator [Rhodomicrobium]
MRRDIDIGLLRAFVAVAETGGMTSAARALNLTQAAVSQQIRRLEEFFDIPLFTRGNRKPELTPSGERLFAYSRRMLSLNDEVWGMMTSPDFEGEVKLGVPHDIVTPFIPPILKSFNTHWPRVRVTLVCLATFKLLRLLDDREIDLTLTTESLPGDRGELLLPDQLVWVGARGGDAHKRRPLPVSFGDGSCAFRAATVKALGNAGIDWRLTCETSDFNPYCATLEADLAVAPMLKLAVPRSLQVLGAAEGLPPLPVFYINLRMPAAGGSEIADEMARFIRTGFATPYQSLAA